MSKRRNSLKLGDIVALVGLVVVLAIAGAIASVVQSVGVGTSVAIVPGTIVLVIIYKRAQRQRKIDYLTGKYGDPTIVDHIFNHRYWQGQTAEQLADSLGSPHGVDRKLLKTIDREVWKYNPRGVNRYGLRITLDNGVVSNWDHKQ